MSGFKEVAKDTKAKILDRRPFKHPPKEAGRKKTKKKDMWIFVRRLSLLPTPSVSLALIKL